MTNSPNTVAIWGVVPAAGQSSRMGFPKQAARIGGKTMVANVVRRMLDAGVKGAIVVTRSALLTSLELPNDSRVGTTINDDPNSHMIDSIRIGLDTLAMTPQERGFDDRHNDVGGGGAISGAPAGEDSPYCGQISDDDGVIVVPADMPGIEQRTYAACIDAFRHSPLRIVIATHGGRRGHPIIFPYAMRDALANLPDGLRGLARSYPDQVQLVDTPDPHTQCDINTPDDLRRY